MDPVISGLANSTSVGSRLVQDRDVMIYENVNNSLSFQIPYS